MATPEESRVIPVFKVLAVHNEGKSKDAGRPIYDDLEVVEVRFAGDRQRVGVFPAHAFAGHQINENGYEEEITYAQKYSEQYRRFKAKHQQIAEGTPVDELAFLTVAKRSELKALNILTAEALSSLDGRELAALGIGGRQLKDQATAYLKAANGTAEVTKLASDNVSLQSQIAEMRQEMSQMRESAKARLSEHPLNEKTDEELKALIKEKTGQAPRGQPSHETLVRMAIEVSQEDKAA
jgi:outer membrane murein-binding lipoprotein Lpp